MWCAINHEKQEESTRVDDLDVYDTETADPAKSASHMRPIQFQ